ncbi:hypothetical protein [Ruminococcus albus]|uniref:Lipoprotein n=1 Tax=Ruminococcus albus TaxID=1264 RepID=A0A1I1D5K4_RUMAL|nr:hypothetical protein [Ruminococcus albus]SFB70195.1 hypothetical protein SAMN02910406_00250 [Ruminococcus albus]
MLAEVLYRVKKLFTAAAAAVFALSASGCEWDDAEIPETGSAADKLTTDDEIVTEEESLTEVGSQTTEKDGAITIAKAVFEKWLEVLAEGDNDTADEMMTEDLKGVAPRSRLFNEYFPGKARTEYFAPAGVSEDDGVTTVTLRVTVYPEDLPFGKVSAEVSVLITADDSGKIDEVREIGTDASDEKTLYRNAYIAYNAAAEVFDEIDPVTAAGMHHMGEGSDLTAAVWKEMRPEGAESFSIAVRDNKLMYVCWGCGAYSQRYPKPKQE